MGPVPAAEGSAPPVLLLSGCPAGDATARLGCSASRMLPTCTLPSCGTGTMLFDVAVGPASCMPKPGAPHSPPILVQGWPSELGVATSTCCRSSSTWLMALLHWLAGSRKLLLLLPPPIGTAVGPGIGETSARWLDRCSAAKAVPNVVTGVCCSSHSLSCKDWPVGPTQPASASCSLSSDLG